VKEKGRRRRKRSKKTRERNFGVDGLEEKREKEKAKRGQLGLAGEKRHEYMEARDRPELRSHPLHWMFEVHLSRDGSGLGTSYGWENGDRTWKTWKTWGSRVRVRFFETRFDHLISTLRGHPLQRLLGGKRGDQQVFTLARPRPGQPS